MEPTRSQGLPGDQASATGLVFEARLVHAEAGRRVVEVSAWRRRECLGRCLGEAEDAEAAEDRALARLQRYLASQPAASSHAPRAAPRMAVSAGASPRPGLVEPAASQVPGVPSEQPGEQLSPQSDPDPDDTPGSADEPEDWSEELAALDVQLQRLGWDRSREGLYLERAFGHPSRSRLTAYADLLAYLRALRGLPHGSQPEQAAVPLRRKDLLSQCDELIDRLGWDAGQGRQLLEREFQLSSRQQLSDDDLLRFNMALETELVNRST